MNIKSVRFPNAVAVIKGECYTEWSPGKRGVKEIRTYHDMALLFLLDDGSSQLVQIHPGTVICVDAPDTTGQTFTLAKMTASPTKEPDGHASSTPSQDPPPARPIPARGRVQR